VADAEVRVPVPARLRDAASLAEYFPDYNEERIHAALDYRTPWAVYREAA
jgi:transposase InsO family protein